MSNTATHRMRMIADDLAQEGNYTRGASVYECAGERDALDRLKDNIRLVAECEPDAANAIKNILELIKEHDTKKFEGNKNAKR